MNKYILDVKKYAEVAKRAAAEGAVLLENKNHLLPLKDETSISIFGRIQLSYYKSGTGSGGLVNTEYVVSILDALLAENRFHVNMELLEKYKAWVEENPFDMGNGWAQEPWCQKEMPLTAQDVKDAREKSDTAIVIIGRSAGEDKDAGYEKGSYLLNDTEEEMLNLVSKAFDKVIVLLNVGGIMDMSWMDRYQISSVLYVWQGGCEGGNAVCDILTGRVNPSGRLTDTIAYEIEDYPSTANFGNDDVDLYKEDIYVGYRYFETFAESKVRYPFGFGLSYTEFAIYGISCIYNNGTLHVECMVKNSGDAAGREVVQLYIKAPQGKLGKAKRALISFGKTKKLEPLEEQLLKFDISEEVIASYDDSGVTGFRYSYVMEAGTYEIFVGSNVRDAAKIGEFALGKDVVVKKCGSALAPITPFERMRPKAFGGGNYVVDYESVPLREYDIYKRISDEKLTDYDYTGDFGYKLADVYDRKISMGTFISQLSDEDLRCIVRGEGMCSGRVTPGTASAFGGVSDGLTKFGIPAGCCSDGPSGIRMDCGTTAFQIPNGTCMACSFDEELNEELFTYLGCELRKNQIDTLLGPGINIHRNPLNGRNFEYFSEDPILTGKMAAAQLRGMHKYNVTGTIKHFAGNNQEHSRRRLNSVISERALREIYLKGFEMAVKEAGAYSIMTTYGAVNGVYTAGSFDLNTTILRKEWGFEGIVMSDWWADLNEENGAPDNALFSAMVRSQNDLYMVVQDSQKNEEIDDLKVAMENGRITRAMLVRSAINILKVLMRSPVMDRSLGRLSDDEKEAMKLVPKEVNEALNLEYIPMDKTIDLDISRVETKRGSVNLFGIESSRRGKYELEMVVTVDASELAQIPISFYANGVSYGTRSLRGTDKGEIVIRQEIGLFLNKHSYIKISFGQGGTEVKRITVTRTEDFEF